MREGDFKLVWSGDDGAGVVAGPGAELFQVREDPGERRDLSSAEPERLAALEQRFRSDLERAQRDAARYRSGGEAQLTPEELEQLRELGYLGSGSSAASSP